MSKTLTREALAEGVSSLSRRDADLGRVVRAHGLPPMWGRRAGFATLLRIILEQQVSLASADAAYRRLSARLGRVTPRAFLELGDAELKRVGFSRQKTRYGRELARAIQERRLDLRSIEGLPDADASAQLKAIPGVGEWTASIYLLMALRRADVWPRGDLALVKSAWKVKSLPGRPDDAKLAGISEAWRPWRSVAARILWHAYLCERREG